MSEIGFIIAVEKPFNDNSKKTSLFQLQFRVCESLRSLVIKRITREYSNAYQ
jgi:hypothetical protein